MLIQPLFAPRRDSVNKHRKTYKNIFQQQDKAMMRNTRHINNITWYKTNLVTGLFTWNIILNYGWYPSDKFKAKCKHKISKEVNFCIFQFCAYVHCSQGSLLITKTRLYNFNPLKPHFYIVKLGFTWVYIIFSYFVKKHRLWVLVRTASARRF